MSAVVKPAPAEPRSPRVVHPTVPRGSLRKVNVRRFSGSEKLSPGVSGSSSQLSLAQGSIFQDKQHVRNSSSFLCMCGVFVSTEPEKI